MAKESMQWVFTAGEAPGCARDVVHHDPAAPRARRLIPEDETAAAAGVAALADQLKSLPASIRNALNNAESSAAHISEDRLQGLAELIQNADDLSATAAELAIDEAGSRLLFRHNGAGLTLHDVWALAIPWLSLKVDDSEQLGRFGIGLKTLHSLSDVLEVHEGYFHILYQAQDLNLPDGAAPWPTSDPRDGWTTFVVPFAPGAVTRDDVASWLTQWGDVGLVFLTNLGTVTLLDDSGDAVARLRASRGPAEEVSTEDAPAVRRVVTAADGRGWVVYSRRVPSPRGQKRARKAQAAQTPIAVAFPLFDADIGHLHIGLPVRPIGLPFRVLAQFDPLASRRDISNTPWNHTLVEPISRLWRDAVLDHFTREPSRAWSVVPLAEEFDTDDRTIGQLRTEFERHLMTAARMEFAEAVMLPDADECFHLPDLACEAPELEDVLTAADVRLVAGTAATVTAGVRSVDDRWRRVLAEVRDMGAKTPVVVDVADAVTLLDDATRPVEFVADLVAVAVDAGLTRELTDRPCLVLDDDTRVTPGDVSKLRVLLPRKSGPLWDTLGVGTRLHATYRDRSAWPAVRDWLHGHGLLLKDAADTEALQVLAAAGKDGIGLPKPLTDVQADALRTALELVPAHDRPGLGAGIGRAVRFAATVYGETGARISMHARPCEAYIIEREANTWRVAAGKTPGLVWLHSRYSEKLRAERGRDGIGAQRLFRLLGAETAPRLIEHPAREQRYKHGALGVRRYAVGSPPRRDAQMDQHKATYSTEDYMSPDLDAVLASIAKEKKVADRVKRATAVLNTLTRAWEERLRPYAHAKAVREDYGWVNRGDIDAWWVASAASIPWLTAGSGAAAFPDRLRVRTTVTEALFGDDRQQYLADHFDTSAYQRVLAVLGVQGDPRPDEVLGRLREIRAEVPHDPERAADLAAPLYKALASQIHGRGMSRRVGTMNSSALRTAVGEGDGLVATNVGWRRQSVVLSGPAVFGAMLPFVPAVAGAEPLWDLLGVRSPTHVQAKYVLRRLSRKRALTKDQQLVMLEALRILAATPPDQIGQLRRSAVWVGDEWVSHRPVYAVANPLIAQGLAGRIPMWSPGGSLTQVGSLVEPYALTRLDTSHAQVRHTDSAAYDADLTQMFASAVMNLREDLALSDPNSEASLLVTWDELAEFSVYVLPGLTVTLPDVAADTELAFTPKAWLDQHTATFYVTDPEEVGSPASGAYAVASVFKGDIRRISHDWLAAWVNAVAGHRAEAVQTAASLEAEQKRAREGREAETGPALQQLAEEAKKRRAKSTASRPGSQGKDIENGGQQKRQQPPRLLVDPSTLTLTSAGEIVGGGSSWPSRIGRGGVKAGLKLRDPDKNRKKESAGGSKAPTNYTAEERESLGMDIARWVLGLDVDEIVDIRNQHNVGADAVDKLKNFYELKVHSGPIPDVIKLEPAQIERAQQTEGFFLIVIGNLEKGAGNPEVRIITNPLDQLVMRPTTSVNYRGVLSAHSLRYTFDIGDPGEGASA